MTFSYESHYKYLKVDIKDGIALVTLNRESKLNACNEAMHKEIGHIWKDLDNDDRVRVSVVTGAGRGFCAGGEMEMLERIATDPAARRATEVEARDLVYNMVNSRKPIISAINGPAVGAGMALAIMADISIASERAKFSDGHLKLGVAAGDHACAIWPLLCGLAKAKLYLLTGDFIPATTAERINLISMVVEHDELMNKAMAIAKQLAEGPQHALANTKYAINQWIRDGGMKSFDLSLALEIKNFAEEDAAEGIEAIKAKRKPNFPSAKL